MSDQTTTTDSSIDGAASALDDGLERRRLQSALITLAAQMARRQNMPSPDDWPGWSARAPQKLWRAARDECERASNQCADWAYEIRKIADAL